MGDGLSTVPSEYKLIKMELAKAERNADKHDSKTYSLMVKVLQAKLSCYKSDQR